MIQFFGLDIGSYYIKGVELERTKEGTYSVVSFGVVPSPVNLAVANSDADIRTLADAVSELVKTYRFSGTAVTTLPEGQLFSFVVDFPKMSEKELAKSLQWEAEQYIPMPLDEVSLDYQVLDPLASTRDDGRMEVALIAAPKKVVNNYLSVIRQAGLETASVENQTSAVVRALHAGGADAPTALYVSMGASSTDFAIVRAGAVRFTRSIPTGGSVMTRAVAEKLGFDVQQAEEYKKTHGLLDAAVEGKVREALLPVVGVIVSEIRRAIAFYTSRYHPDSIKKVVLFGGSALLPGLLGHLAETVDLEIEIANATRVLTYPESATQLKPQLESLSPIATVALGLAMKEIE